MPTRSTYRLSLHNYRPPHLPAYVDLLDIRRAQAEDAEELARLMLDAYVGAIDYANETLDDARKEMGEYLAGGYGEPLLDHSWVCAAPDTLAGACLMADWQGAPLVAFVMTRARWKSLGIAQALLQCSLVSLMNGGYTQVIAFITNGNTPSERLFARAGFSRVT